MKKKKTIFILGIFLILLIGVYGIIIMNNKKQKEKAEETTQTETQETKTLLNLNQEDIVKLSYVKENNTMEFEKKEDTWIYTSNPEFPIRQNYLTNMISIFTNLAATRTIEETTKNLNEYGLEKPAYTIVITTSDQKQTTLYLGTKNPVTSDYYVYIDGVEGVYTIGSDRFSYFDYSLYEMTQADIFPTIDSSSIDELSLTWNGQEIKLETLEQSSYDSSDLISWYITSPFEHEIVADSSVIDTQLQKIENIMYAKLAAFQSSSFTEEQLEEMGLINPKGKISFHYTDSKTGTLEEKSYTMLIGNSDGSEYYYAMEEGSNKVNFISASTIDSIMTYTANDYIYKYFALVNIETVDEVLVQEGDMIFSLKDIPKTSSEENQNEEQEQRESEIRSLYRSIISINAEKVIDMGEEEIEWIDFQVTFKRNDEKEDIVLKFAVYDTNFYLTSVNGEARYLVNKRDFENYKSTILEGFQKFSE